MNGNAAGWRLQLIFTYLLRFRSSRGTEWENKAEEEDEGEFLIISH